MAAQPKRILIAQTAFIGDVILATPLIEGLAQAYPQAQIDFLLRKGNEGLLEGHPKLSNLLVWDKKKGKYKFLLRIIKDIRAQRYDLLINCQRFFTSGLMSLFSGAKLKIGFSKNPLSAFYHRSLPHLITEGVAQHEVDRNLSLLGPLGLDNLTEYRRPRLYPPKADYDKVKPFKNSPYLCMAPASVWFTKQFPYHKWIELLDHLSASWQVFLVGGPGDRDLCNRIIEGSSHRKVKNLAGKLSFLQTAALFDGAHRVYSNDSAPMHIASAMNVPTKAIFCSTIPDFGFGPLAATSEVVQIAEEMNCRPCGLHGKKKCPKGHFHCAEKIQVDQLLSGL